LARKEVKAILVDEYSTQVKGLGKYFEQDYRELGHDAEWHIFRIVKVCQFHYEQTVNALQKKKKVPNGTILVKDCLIRSDICRILHEIPHLQTQESFVDSLTRVRTYAALPEAPKGLSTWLKHKNDNPWIFFYVCAGLQHTCLESFGPIRASLLILPKVLMHLHRDMVLD
jgi:hypothetical protein